MKYQYKVINPEKSSSNLENDLNILGADGWKVVAMANGYFREAQLVLMKEREIL